jgi:hypothetical protein
MVNARARREGLKTHLAPARVAGLITDLETHRRSVDSAETDNCSLVIGVFELANSTRNGLGAISGHHEGECVLPSSPDRLLLKHNYCNIRQRNSGYLEDVVEREGLQQPDLPCRGHAGARLANRLAVARWLRTQTPRKS